MNLSSQWTLVTCLCLSQGGCLFASNQAYDAGNVARFTLPSGWSQRETERQSQWSAFQFRKPQSFWFGAGNPFEVDGWVIVGAPEATGNDVEQGMDFAFRQIQDNSRRFPESGDVKTGSRTTWMSEGSYQISALHDPEKVFFLRSIDPVRQTALVLRVYQRQVKHEELRAIEQTFFASLKYQDGRARYFAGVPAPAKGKQRRAAEIAYLNAFLRSHGLPLLDPLNPLATQAHDGWIYGIKAGQFVIARRLGDGPKGEMVERGRGELAWLEFDGRAWRSRSPQVKTRPAGSEPYFQSQPVPADWARILALDTDRTRRYFFQVWSCELTPMDSEESNEPAGWELDDWFAQAQAVAEGHVEPGDRRHYRGSAAPPRRSQICGKAIPYEVDWASLDAQRAQGVGAAHFKSAPQKVRLVNVKEAAAMAIEFSAGGARRWSLLCQPVCADYRKAIPRRAAGIFLPGSELKESTLPAREKEIEDVSFAVRLIP